jgi:hypothetical protein
MPKFFTRIITFKVEGELYDECTSAEDIIRNYTFNYRDYNDDGPDKCFLFMTHDDNRGKITKLTRLPKIHKWKKPDTEFFVKM